MYIVFEENTSLRLGSLLAEEASAYMIELKNGRRLKLKKNQVLTTFEGPLSDDFLLEARQMSQTVDVDILWGCLDQGDHTLMTCARTYFGDQVTATQVMAILYVLYQNPFYFYKRAKGQYRLATPENLQAALAGAARKAREREALAADVALLCQGRWPYSESAVNEVLFGTSQMPLRDKAIQMAATEKKLTIPALLLHCGCLSGPYDYWYRKFVSEYGLLFSAQQEAICSTMSWDLPVASVAAFSIDDSTTTEIDDAFSVVWQADGTVEVGVHIAVPTLACLTDEEEAARWFALIRSRMSTVYIPGEKFTMLPSDYIEQFTLKEQCTCFAVSLYFSLDPVDYRIIQTRSLVERVFIADNLRLPDMQSGFSPEDFETGQVLTHRWGKELSFLYRAAHAFLSQRQAQSGQHVSGKNRLDYHFYIDRHDQGDEVRIVVRPRGQPLDVLVAEWMVIANWQWASMMTSAAVPIIYRGIDNNKVRLSSTPLPHKTMGLDQYAWFSSPLRRYVDFQNQWQLLSVLMESEPVSCRSAEALDGDILRFQMLYPQYDEFQRTMERYWSLVWLEKRLDQLHEAIVLYDRQVALRDVPVTVRVPLQQLEAVPVGGTVFLSVSSIDLWTLTVSAHVQAPPVSTAHEACL